MNPRTIKKKKTIKIARGGDTGDDFYEHRTGNTEMVAVAAPK